MYVKLGHVVQLVVHKIVLAMSNDETLKLVFPSM